LPDIFIQALLFAVVMLAIKPLVFAKLLKAAGEKGRLPAEVGVRLGQISEFSLLIAILALNAGAIGSQASYLIQAATLITFIVSAYIIMLNYPTPIAVSDRLRKD
jgi:predicted Kef-type K+ transport protein